MNFFSTSSIFFPNSWIFFHKIQNWSTNILGFFFRVWGFFFQQARNFDKTKVVVWGAIRTAMKPEKKIWTAEIEIYRWGNSKGSLGTGKISKWSVCFWILGPLWQRVIVDGRFFCVLVSAGALKVEISLSKIDFRWNFDQKHYFSDFCQFHFSFFCIFQICPNFDFWVFLNFVKSWKKNPKSWKKNAKLAGN